MNGLNFLGVDNLYVLSEYALVTVVLDLYRQII